MQKIIFCSIVIMLINTGIADALQMREESNIKTSKEIFQKGISETREVEIGVNKRRAQIDVQQNDMRINHFIHKYINNITHEWSQKEIFDNWMSNYKKALSTKNIESVEKWIEIGLKYHIINLVNGILSMKEVKRESNTYPYINSINDIQWSQKEYIFENWLSNYKQAYATKNVEAENLWIEMGLKYNIINLVNGRPSIREMKREAQENSYAKMARQKGITIAVATLNKDFNKKLISSDKYKISSVLTIRSHCLQIAISESHQSDQIIDLQEVRQICAQKGVMKKVD